MKIDCLMNIRKDDAMNRVMATRKISNVTSHVAGADNGFTLCEFTERVLSISRRAYKYRVHN